MRAPRFERAIATAATIAAAAGFGGCGARDREVSEEEFMRVCQTALTINAKEQLLADDFSSDIADTERARDRFEDGCGSLWPLYERSRSDGPLDLENPYFSEESYAPEEPTRQYLEEPYREALTEIMAEREAIHEELPEASAERKDELESAEIELNNERAVIIGALSDVEALEEIAEEQLDD